MYVCIYILRKRERERQSIDRMIELRGDWDYGVAASHAHSMWLISQVGKHHFAVIFWVDRQPLSMSDSGPSSRPLRGQNGTPIPVKRVHLIFTIWLFSIALENPL